MQHGDTRFTNANKTGDGRGAVTLVKGCPRVPEDGAKQLPLMADQTVTFAKGRGVEDIPEKRMGVRLARGGKQRQWKFDHRIYDCRLEINHSAVLVGAAKLLNAFADSLTNTEATKKPIV